MPPLTDKTWLWFAAACYLAGVVLGTIALWRERRHSRAVMYAIVAAGYTFQTFGLYLRGLEVKGCPLGNTFELFQFTAWSAATLYLIIGPAFRLSLLGYFTSLLSATLTLTALAVPAWDATRRIGIFGGNPWIDLHAALALFSYGVFGLLALTSVLYLLRHYSLKNKRIGGAFTFLPSIRDLDQIGYRLLWAGVAILTVSLAVGSFHWLRDLSSVASWKLVTTIGVLAAYGTTLALRAAGRLVGQRLSLICALLYLAALISLWAVNSSRPALNHPAAATEVAPR
jgi:HemX protein